MSEHLLWVDEDLYQQRYEKAASALVAIKMALERNTPLHGGEREFLELFDTMAAADAEAFTQVWRDPTAYFWVRLGYEFVGNCLTPGPLSSLAQACSAARGASDPLSALAGHIKDFKRFALALAIVSKRDLIFREALEVALPFAIPGTRFVLSGGGKAAIAGVAARNLEVAREGSIVGMPLYGDRAGPDSLDLRECPLAATGDYQVCLQPEAYNLAGLELAEPLTHLPPGFQSEHAELAGRALGLIGRHTPEFFEHFRAIIRVIGLKPPSVGNFSNVSHSDLPGSFVCTVIRDPYWMAEGFIHELHHNRLFFIEELGAFFAREADNRMTDSGYYSPWRDDPRPLHGILHGLYVYIAVWRFLVAVYQSGELSGAQLVAAKDQIVRIAMQSAIAVVQLRRFAEFTGFGAGLFETMAGEVSRIQDATLKLGLSGDLPAMEWNDAGVLIAQRDRAAGRELTVLGAILAHAEKYDLNRQCGEVESIVRINSRAAS